MARTPVCEMRYVRSGLVFTAGRELKQAKLEELRAQLKTGESLVATYPNDRETGSYDAIVIQNTELGRTDFKTVRQKRGVEFFGVTPLYLDPA